MQAVTASELVRHFGAWRDRAMTTPVYIHHHGRPKLVLTSVDFLEHLASTSSAGGSPEGGLAELLDMIDAIVLVMAADLSLLGVSPSARHLLGRSDWRGQTLEQVLPDTVRPFLLRAARAVLDSGRAERLQLRLGRRGDRRVDVTVQPFEGGVCIVGQDRTASEAQAMTDARSRAVEAMLGLLGNVAWLRINPRGYVVDASASFEALTGLTAAAYRSVRLPTLFDIQTRVAVGDALERAIDEMSAHIVEARLLTTAGQAIPARIAVSGEMLRVSGDTILATVSAEPATSQIAG